MLSLWFRTAQAKSICQCPGCTTAANVVGRRAGTGATRSRSIRYGETVTLSLMATAAIVDAERKHERRVELENAIADAKDALELDRRETARLREKALLQSSSSTARADTVTASSRSLKRKLSTAAPLLPSDAIDVNASYATWLRKASMQPRPEHLERPNLISNPWNHYAPQSIYGEGKPFRLKDIWSVRKVFVAKASVRLLVARMLNNADIDATERDRLAPLLDADLADPSKFVKSERAALMKTKWMKSLHFTPAYPLYHQHPHGYHRQITKDLNRSIVGLFQAFENGEITKGALASRICHNLLVSEAPPDTWTYNLLLSHASRLGVPEITDPVIRSMITAQIRPNEVTFTVILDFFVSEGNREGFFAYLHRALGDKRGLMLARPDIQITEAGENYLIPRENGKIIQLPRMNDSNFAATINGLLKFNSLELALEFYRRMVREGWSSSTKVLTMLLRDAAVRRDWAAGLIIWDEMLKTHAKESSQCLDLSAFMMKIRLCRNAHRKRELLKVPNEAKDCGLNEDAVQLLRSHTVMTQRLWLETDLASLQAFVRKTDKEIAQCSFALGCRIRALTSLPSLEASIHGLCDNISQTAEELKMLGLSRWQPGAEANMVRARKEKFEHPGSRTEGPAETAVEVKVQTKPLEEQERTTVEEQVPAIRPDLMQDHAVQQGQEAEGLAQSVQWLRKQAKKMIAFARNHSTNELRLEFPSLQSQRHMLVKKAKRLGLYAEVVDGFGGVHQLGRKYVIDGSEIRAGPTVGPQGQQEAEPMLRLHKKPGFQERFETKSKLGTGTMAPGTQIETRVHEQTKSKAA